MSHFQIQLPLHNLPLTLVLVSDGSVALVKQQQVFPHKILQDYNVDGKPFVVFADDSFSVSGEVFQYSMLYKLSLYNTLKEWLCSENLQLPEHIEHMRFM